MCMFENTKNGDEFPIFVRLIMNDKCRIWNEIRVRIKRQIIFGVTSMYKYTICLFINFPCRYPVLYFNASLCEMKTIFE